MGGLNGGSRPVLKGQKLHLVLNLELKNCCSGDGGDRGVGVGFVCVKWLFRVRRYK